MLQALSTRHQPQGLRPIRLRHVNHQHLVYARKVAASSTSRISIYQNYNLAPSQIVYHAACSVVRDAGPQLVHLAAPWVAHRTHHDGSLMDVLLDYIVHS